MQYRNNSFPLFAIIGTRLYIEFTILSMELNRKVRLCFFMLLKSGQIQRNNYTTSKLHCTTFILKIIMKYPQIVTDSDSYYNFFVRFGSNLVPKYGNF